MINILDVFNQNAFGVIALTSAVNDITPTYGMLGRLGLFKDESVNTRTVAVDFDPITNALLPQVHWGAPAIANKSLRAKTKSWSIPHFPISDLMLAGDIQGARRPGSDSVADGQYFLGRKLLEMRTKLEQTLEWLRLGAIKGIVKDGAGTTVLDLWTDFGISQPTLGMALSTAGTDVLGKSSSLTRIIEQALRGEIMENIIALCSDTFWDAFTAHANVKAAFQYYSVNSQNLANSYRGGFNFGGVTWINYTGSVPDPAGSAQKMIEDDAAYAFPTGTNVFKTFFAPADYMETVNTMGQPFYAKQERMKFDKGIEVECQSNPLPVVLKPGVVVKLTKV